MTNLIPPQGKKALKIEYWLRTLSVWAILLSGALFMIVGLLMPTYVLITSQYHAASAQQTTAIEEDVAAYEAELDSVSAANMLAQRLAAQSPGLRASVILAKIREVLTDDVRITSFEFTNGAIADMTINVTGIAATRRALVDFTEALEAKPGFAEVKIPVSDLAKERDLPFTARIALAKDFAQ